MDALSRGVWMDALRRVVRWIRKLGLVEWMR